ncbi:MAG: hypothetical protein ACXIU7_02610 [Roseinatronobacter sp.]
MKTRDRLERMRAIATLKRDLDLAKLAQHAAEQAETREKLDALSQPLPAVSDPCLFRAQQAHLLWAEQQRINLNNRLALQTARFLEQRNRAAVSFGRAHVVTRITSDAQGS